jgi:hypothetical protein
MTAAASEELQCSVGRAASTSFLTVSKSFRIVSRMARWQEQTFAVLATVVVGDPAVNPASSPPRARKPPILHAARRAPQSDPLHLVPRQCFRRNDCRIFPLFRAGEMAGFRGGGTHEI